MPDEFKEYVVPGSHVWITVDEKGKEATYGRDRDLVYQGYQHIATATFLIFDLVEGEGKKAVTKSMAKNANRVTAMGNM